MLTEDVIIQIMLNPDKPKRVVLFKPTDPTDTRKKLITRRPNEHAILPKEIYENPRTPISEKDTITALNKMLEEGRIENLWTQKGGDKILWWVIK